MSEAKIHTIGRRADFLAANKGSRAPMPGFVLLVREREDGDPAMRLGITVTRKIGGAVVRNRMKRRFRALAREILPEQGFAGADHILIGRAGGVERDFSLLRVELRKALKKVQSTSVRPEPVEACPERPPQAGSRRGPPFPRSGSKNQDKASTGSAQTVSGVDTGESE